MSDMSRSPTPPPPARPYDIALGPAEVITVDLDNLDNNPEDLIDLLKDGKPKVGVWTKLAGEYWRKGLLSAAEDIARAGVETFQTQNDVASLPPIYALLANLQIARARNAPKIILSNARQDDMSSEKSKDQFHQEATTFLNQNERAGAASGEASNILSILTRGITQLATRSIDESLRSFEGVLAQKPTNLVALLGKARILFVRRQYPQALKVFQQVLQLDPYCLPDPRIGIGLCLWNMDNKSKAVAAWQRSVEVNPREWPSKLLLGLEAINASKNESQTDAERARAFLAGTKHVESAFKLNKRSAAIANVLADVFLRKGQLRQAIKLAERTIQFADTITLLAEGYTRAGRVAHAEGLLGEAARHFNSATRDNPKNIVASVGLAQVQIKNDEFAAAIHTLDTLLQPPNAQKSLEATMMLASLRAHPRPGVSSADATKERERARELFDIVYKALELHTDRPPINGNGIHKLSRAHRRLGEDVDVHAEIARLWQAEDLGRAKRALREGVRIGEASTQGQADPRLMNNLGAILHLDGDYAEARRLYEGALTLASKEGVDRGLAEGVSTTVLYNLARSYEALGLDLMAKEAYEKLLSRHPEYVDAKIRQAQMLVDLNRHNEAHELIKQSLESQAANLDLRAFYTHFLIQSNLPKVAKEFVFGTLREHDKHDVYSLCAAGWIQYNQARENREQPPAARKDGFRRAAEFYDKALQIDPLCAVAAQGLAIVTAEDALGTLGGALPPGPSADEVTKRHRNAREALDVFGKVRESISDGSVYLNIGHCHYARDEFDRAIESYDTALKRYYDGHNVSVLLCLCRSWFAKASKDQSFASINTSLRYAQQALHLQPGDKAILYNIAMIQQKAAEMLFALPPTKRTLIDLQAAIAQAEHGQRLFAALAADKASVIPYPREIADQRRKYGESLLRKAPEHVATQQQHEDEQQARLTAARQKRQEDKNRQQQLEDQRVEELRQAAEKLAVERRKAREQALEWTREVKMESDEERERKVKRANRKAIKSEGVSDAELEGESQSQSQPRKRRVKKKKVDDDDAALFSENEEEDQKPAKKARAKKRIIRDEDDEDTSGAPRKKQFKSKEVIDSSDEDME